MPTARVENSTTESDIWVPASPRPASYREVFAGAEFRAVFLADLVSLIGDQIAAVALAVLLYQGSGSPLVAALGYSTAYLPWLLGGPLLAAWAGRRAGRSVMVGCDLARAVLIGLAAIPGLPLAVIGLLVLAAAFLAPPFDAARSALLPHLLSGDRYPVAVSLRDAVHQSAQLVGFGVGGALVVVLTSPGALALDALTFAGSALVLRAGLTLRPAGPPATIDLTTLEHGEPGEHGEPASDRGRRRSRPAAAASLRGEARAGLAVIRADPRLRTPLLLGITGAAYTIVPEAVAPAYAASVGGGATAVGLIMAAVAAGSVLGGLAVGRLAGPATRVRLIRPLALAGTVPLLLTALRPGLVASLLLFAGTGLASAFQVAANATFGQRVPAGVRTQVFGIAITGLHGGQAAAIVLAGAVAQVAPPSGVVAGAGLLGAAGVLLLVRPGPHRAAGRSPRGRHLQV
jgi:MFS family permease